MKRPEGFDPQPPARKAPRRPAIAKAGPAAQPRPQAAAESPEQPPARQRPPRRERSAALPPGNAERPTQERRGRRSSADDSVRQARDTARLRRRYEREEVRRFTRRARHRRFVWLTAVSVVVALVATVAIAVYSPILALTKIEVTGTSSVSADEVLEAVDGQLGTPLAWVDSDRLTRELARFTLIQSYVTETIPPGTLVIHITERKAIGSVATGSGFTVVDPAGVVIEKTDTRPPGVPMIELAGADTDSDVFASVVEVLLTLPQSVAGQVDRVTAATKDDVTLVLAGAGQRVVWGSADQSELKARVLASLMATRASDARVEYDVTAPLSAVIRAE